MFTWICQQCGREVSPSMGECPACKAQRDAPPTAEQLAHPPAPAHRAGLPTWLLSIVFALAFVGLVGGVYFIIQRMRPVGPQSDAPMIDMAKQAKGAKQHPLQKFIEVGGIRLLVNKAKQVEARFVVVNHSQAEITGLAANVNIWGRTAKSEEEPEGSLKFTIPSIGSNESKEITVPVNTKKKAYELPDWQNVNMEVQITAP